jgi:hypothetical protein
MRAISISLVVCTIPLFALASAQNADAARSCTVASDCPKGFQCEPVENDGVIEPIAGSSGEANDGSTPQMMYVMAQALSVDGQAIDSNAGSTSADAAGPGSTSLEAGAVASVSGSECTWSTCQSNSDCGPGFSCTQACWGYYVGLNSGIDTTACVPQWQLLCSADSDCGDGFKCVNTDTECDCSGPDAGVPPEAGAVSVPCAEAGSQPPTPEDIAFQCQDGPTCLCFGTGGGVCQQIQTGPCSQSTDCPMGWTCTMMACEPPNSDLAWPGFLYYCPIADPPPPTQQAAPGSGVSNGGAVSTGGSGGPTESNASGGSAGSGGTTGAGGPPAPKSGGCEIAMKPAGSASSCAVLILLASVARGLRRKVKSGLPRESRSGKPVG